ncbi:MAG: hypothetical protein ACI3XG_10715 [Faecousia sp.]
MKKAIMCAALALALSVNAYAMEVPTDTVVQNLNGSQQVIKTYTTAPDYDPQNLIEEPFELEGYLYTFADIVKAENHVEDADRHTETVTVETSKNDLSLILEQLAPTLEYDDGLYSGTLALDHTSIRTEAAGYTTKSSTVSETKTIGPVDRNDMSYVPATTVKNGVTLSLANVDWQVIGTDLVGEALVPSSYQAVATYTGKSYYSAATGYVTTADYVGEISHDGVESITYTLTYLGVETDEAEADVERAAAISKGDIVSGVLPYVLGGLGLAAVIILAALLLRSRSQVKQLQAEQEIPDADYEEQEETRE